MGEIYLGTAAGTGAEDDPIRPPEGGDNRIGWIPFGPPGTPGVPCLLYLPEPSRDWRLTKISDGPTVVSRATRKALSSRLGLNLFDDKTCAQLLAEILMDHGRDDGRGHIGIRGFPSAQRHAYEIWLGELGRIWHQRATGIKHSQTFHEGWPGADGDVTAGNGRDLTWTEVSGGGNVASGVVRPDAVNTVSICKCSSNLDTGNQTHQADFALVDTAGANNFVSTLLRLSGASDYYRYFVRRNNGTYQRQTLKRVAASNTVFANATTDPGATGTMLFSVDGATIIGWLGTTPFNMTIVLGPTTDGSPALTTNVQGGILMFAETTIGHSTMDNHIIADVARALPPVAPMTNPMTHLLVR